MKYLNYIKYIKQKRMPESLAIGSNMLRAFML